MNQKALYGVFANASRHFAVRVGDDLDGVQLVLLGASGLSMEIVPHASFDETWTASDYDLAKAYGRFNAHGQREGAVNDPQAVQAIQRLGEYVAEMEAKASSSAPAPQQGLGQASSNGAAAVTGSPAEGATTIDQAQVVSAPAGAPEAGVASPVAAAASATTTTATAAPEGGVDLAVAVQPALQDFQPNVVPEKLVVTQPALDEGNFTVSVEKGAVKVEMGRAPQDGRFGHDHFSARQAQPGADQGEPMFYVATDEEGRLKGLVSKNEVDSKVVGALVGGWIADNLVVRSVGLKELYKVIGAARKAA